MTAQMKTALIGALAGVTVGCAIVVLVLLLGGCINSPDLMEACKKACAPGRMARQGANECVCQPAPMPDAGPQQGVDHVPR